MSHSPEQDHLIRVVTRDGNLRGIACTCRNLVSAVCRLHQTSPTAAVALGRALAGGALMGALLKGSQRVALKFEGNGPLGKILVEAEADGTVSGYVGNPRADLPPRDGHFDVEGLLGRAGLLTVTKDLGLREPYSGTVQLVSSTVAKDLAYYFTDSEQIPSAVGLGVLLNQSLEVSAAGGFLVQSLPRADESAEDRVIETISSMPPTTEMIREGKTPEDILRYIFGDLPLEVLEERPVFFKCHCSRDRMLQALKVLGREEIESIVEEQDGLELRCDFCGTKYRFRPDELEGLFEPVH